MFNSIHVGHDDRNRITTYRGWFGYSFKNYMAEKIKRNDVLFITIRADIIEIYDFFLLEFYYIIKEMSSKGSLARVNAKTLLNVMTDIETNSWLKDYLNPNYVTNKRLNYSKANSMFRFKPLKEQEQAFKDFELMRDVLGYRGFLLHAVAGTGKTMMSLTIAEALECDKIVVVCPIAAISRVWIDSVTSTLYNTPQSYYSSLDKKPYNGQKIIIFHYQAIDRLVDIVNTLDNDNTAFIIDESHNFNELKSKRTKILLEVAKATRSNNVMLLSGTPIKGGLSELVPMLRMLDPRFNSTIEAKFLKLYKSPTNMLKKILPIRYGSYVSMVEKITMEIPPLTKEDIHIKLKDGDKYTLKTISEDIKKYIDERFGVLVSNKQYYIDNYFRLYTKAKGMLLDSGKYNIERFTRYEEDIKTIIEHYKSNSLMQITDIMLRANLFEKELMIIMDKGEKILFRECKTIYKYLKLKIQGEVLGRIVLRARIACHVAMAKAIDYPSYIDSTTKKTIIFTNYIDVAQEAVNSVSQAKYTPLSVFGKESKNLTSTVSKFMGNNSFNPLVATYASLSTAVPLIAANVMLCIDIPYREYTLNQAISRMWRLGQDKPTKVYILRLDTGQEKNINDRNIDIISWYKKEVEDITGTDSGLDIEFEDSVSTEEHSLLEATTSLSNIGSANSLTVSW